MKKAMHVKTAGLILLILLAAFLIVSRTIYAYRLPVVTGAMPFEGRLSKLEKAEGLADFQAITNMYADLGGKVEKIYVKSGDMLQKGQTVLALHFDKTDLEQSLKELQTGLSEEARAAINGSSGGPQEVYAIKQLEEEIKIAEQEFQNAKALYAGGALSQQAYQNTQNTLEVLKAKRKEAERAYSESLKKEMEIYSVQKSAIMKKLSDFSSNETIYAPQSGRLMNFDIKEGQTLLAHDLIGGIGTGNRFEIETSLSLENNFTVAGDVCKVKNANHSFEGTVVRIELQETAKRVAVLVESGEIAPGETFDVIFEKESAQSYMLVPNGALQVDSKGYFLYQIKRREGMIGQEFYIQKLRVYIGDNDDENTAVIKGLSFAEPVTLYSSKPFSEGQAIALSNETDFFAE